MGRSDIGVSLNVSATHMERTSCLAPPYGSLLDGGGCDQGAVEVVWLARK